MSEQSDTRNQGEDAAVEDLELTSEEAAEVGGGTDFVITKPYEAPSPSLSPIKPPTKP